MLTYGATLQSLNFAPFTTSIVIGANSIAPYLSTLKYFGASIGPLANRVAKAKFALEGKAYHLTPNENGKHTLHGGDIGAHNRIWEISDCTKNSVKLQTLFQDGEEGFPGNREIEVEYRLGIDVLDIIFTGKTDKLTPMSLTNHAYFNLGRTDTVDDHLLWVNASAYLPVDADNIPTGEAENVAGTPYDFTKPKRLADSTIDHNFCIKHTPESLVRVAQLYAPDTQVGLELSTTEPGLQVYVCRHLAHENDGADASHKIVPNCGVAIEPQHWPNAVNQPQFPSPLIEPGEDYKHHIRYELSDSILNQL